jgi:hypothetical protein
MENSLSELTVIRISTTRRSPRAFPNFVLPSGWYIHLPLCVPHQLMPRQPPKYASSIDLVIKLRSHKSTIFLLMPPSSTLQTLKEEIARALNDTSDPPRNVKADDIAVYKQSNGDWRNLDEEVKSSKTTTKRPREATLEDLDIKGVGSGSTVENESGSLAYTVKNGLKEEQELEFDPFPRDD